MNLESVFRVRLANGIEARTLRRALVGAARRLTRSQCQTVLSEFQDERGRPLADALANLNIDAPGYLTWVYFRDAAPRYCAWGSLAVTKPGSRAVSVCGRSFEKTWRENPLYAEATLIHEMLHSLGLGENPPPSEAITRRVRLRCEASDLASPSVGIIPTRGASDQTQRPLNADVPVAEALTGLAIDLLQKEQRPTLPIVVVDPATVSKVVAKFAKGNCGFVLLPDPKVIYINAICPFVQKALQPSPAPVAIAAMAALLAHEHRHVVGDNECAARQVELETFQRIVLNLRRERDSDAIRHSAELARRVREIHSLGLGENPPSSRDITDRVRLHCAADGPVGMAVPR